MSVVNPRLVGQYAELHRAAKKYGFTAPNYKGALGLAMSELRPDVVLDYGCGQSDLSEHLKGGAAFYRYDPAVPDCARMPVVRADLVINTDVMEHIPQEDVDDVLADIRRLSARAFFVIATRPALTILPNGENAHCTVKPAEWWLARIARHFDNANIVYELPGWICVIITWRPAAPDLYARMCAAEMEPRPKKKKGALSRGWQKIREVVFRRPKR